MRNPTWEEILVSIATEGDRRRIDRQMDNERRGSARPKNPHTFAERKVRARAGFLRCSCGSWQTFRYHEGSEYLNDGFEYYCYDCSKKAHSRAELRGGEAPEPLKLDKKTRELLKAHLERILAETKEA